MKKLIVLLALLCLVPAAGAAETDSGIVVVLAREGEDPCFIGELSERTE